MLLNTISKKRYVKIRIYTDSQSFSLISKFRYKIKFKIHVLNLRSEKHKTEGQL